MWNELIFTLSQKDCDAACSVLTVINNDGMFIEDFSDLMENDAVRQTHLVDEELLNKIDQPPKIHLYLSPEVNLRETADTAQALLNMNQIKHNLAIAEIPDKNWNTEWMKYYKPVAVTDSLTIVPKWIDYTARPDETVVLLDPGVAFGTGTHETTRLCLQALTRHIKKGHRVLDIGTGSGILAITSLLLGAEKADAIDIDPLSVKAAAENAALNAVSDRLDVKQGDLLEHASGKYDVITANIVTDVLISILPSLPRYLAENGRILLSGIIKEREKDMLESVKQNGFSIIEHLKDGEWVALVIAK